MAVCFQFPPEWPQRSDDDRTELVCRIFERAWRQGEDQRIEDYLESAVDVDREHLIIRLCALERGLRQERGQDLALSECLLRFPQYEAALIRRFGQDESADATIDSTVIFTAEPGSAPQLDPQHPTIRQLRPDVWTQLHGHGG